MEQDKELYNEFIKTVELQDIVLGELEIRRAKAPLSGTLSFDLSPNFTLTERTEDRLTATAEFDLKVHEGNNEEVFTINAKFIIKYTFSKDVKVTEEIEERFTKN